MQQAREIARLFDQHSVAHAEGLVKSDGSTLPFEDGVNKGIDYTDPKSDNYTAVKFNTGSVVVVSKPPKN